MELFRNLSAAGDAIRNGAVAIGNFDGVHRGHARILQRLTAHAQAVGGPSVVFTFEPHPVRLLRPDQAPPPLTWTDRKASLMGQLGVDALFVYPTDLELLGLSPQKFFQQIVVEQLAAQAVVEGPNFYFGHQRSGNTTLLAELCRAQQILLEVVEPLKYQGEYISSSRVREQVMSGQLSEARELLTQPYRIRGMVTHGAARGSQIGFPTANIAAVDTLLPAHGVYGGRAYHANESWPAAVNIGPNPTFGEDQVKVEAHLIGFEGSLYGEPLEVDFLAQLRQIRPFGSVDELKQQLAKDVRAAAQLAQGHCDRS